MTDPPSPTSIVFVSGKKPRPATRNSLLPASKVIECGRRARRRTKDCRRGSAREEGADRLVSERERFFGLIELVEQLQVLQREGVLYDADPRWATPRNLLAAKLSRSVETFPLTASLLTASPAIAHVQDARTEIQQAIDAIEIRIYEHDFG